MEKAIQDLLPGNHCWGCGPDNPRGLQIKSHVEGDETVCRFQPSPDHMAGPTHVVYGGIIASVIDSTPSSPPSPTSTGPPGGRWGAPRISGR